MCWCIQLKTDPVGRALVILIRPIGANTDRPQSVPLVLVASCRSRWPHPHPRTVPSPAARRTLLSPPPKSCFPIPTPLRPKKVQQHCETSDPHWDPDRRQAWRTDRLPRSPRPQPRPPRSRRRPTSSPPQPVPSTAASSATSEQGHQTRCRPLWPASRTGETPSTAPFLPLQTPSLPFFCLACLFTAAAAHRRSNKATP